MAVSGTGSGEVPSVVREPRVPCRTLLVYTLLATHRLHLGGCFRHATKTARLPLSESSNEELK